MVTHALTYIYIYMLCHLHAPRAERSLAVIKKYEGLPYGLVQLYDLSKGL